RQAVFADGGHLLHRRIGDVNSRIEEGLILGASILSDVIRDYVRSIDGMCMKDIPHATPWVTVRQELDTIVVPDRPPRRLQRGKSDRRLVRHVFGIAVHAPSLPRSNGCGTWFRSTL